MAKLANHKIQELFVVVQHQDGFERLLTKHEFKTLNIEKAKHYEKYEQCVARIMYEVKKDLERPISTKPSYYEIKKLLAHPNNVSFEN